MNKIKLPSGELIPALGQGTWNMGLDAGKKKEEVAALRLGLDLGMTLIDTAEMYADGAAEEVVAEAIEGRRSEVFLVTKVLPSHAGRRAVKMSCEKSLKRLRTDHADLYLLHWREDTPLEETLQGFSDLVRSGMIRYWGVSNFGIADMHELSCLDGGSDVSTDQILYNTARRGAEWDLMPWLTERRIPLMAYSPLDQGKLCDHATLVSIAKRLNATPAQIALAWLLQKGRVMVIPKASKLRHVRDNRNALDIRLSAEDMLDIDAAFPPPARSTPLEMV